MAPRDLKIKVFKVDALGNRVTNTVQFINNGYTLFFNAQHLLIKLNSIERCFFDFLCENMSIMENSIYLDNILKSSFKEFFLKVGGKEQQIGNISAAVIKLSDLGLILPESRALYTINPKYAYKGTQAERKVLLSNLLHSYLKAKKSVRFLIETKESTFDEGFQ